MSARTCQLCGKPLSRIWVGADGDFCSREHRNQYRLRLGMDRLLEANKVASLMRRRENPRPISPAQLMCDSAISHRGFFQAKTSSAHPKPGPFSPSPVAPRITAASENYLQPRPTRLTGPSAVRRPDSSLIRFSARRVAPAVPPRRLALCVGLSRAQFARLRDRLRGNGGKRREFGMPRHTGFPMSFGVPSGLRRTGCFPGTGRLNQAQRVRHLESLPRKGEALRVSAGLGLRPPALRPGNVRMRAELSAAMVWSEKPYPAVPTALGCPAAPKFIGIGISTLGVWYPSSPSPMTVMQFEWPKAISLARRAPLEGRAPSSHASEVFWNPSEPEWGRAGPCPAPPGFPVNNGLRLFTMSLAPLGGASAAPQVSVAPFAPQDSLIGYTPRAIQGTIAGAMANMLGRAQGSTSGYGALGGAQGGTPGSSQDSAPGAAQSSVPGSAPAGARRPAVSRLEENFDSGWNNWVGGVEDWRLDAAGVRTGSLALFAPSLEMRDYDLEFLTRIEGHSVTWVFRASNFVDYYMCTIAAAAGGRGYEFTRRAVLGGAAEPAVTAPLAVTFQAKSALTVRTCVRESEFAVSVNGKRIDSWNDSRIPIGGIGFVGAPDDRARLYWVRLSFEGNARKEYRKP